MLPAYNSLPDTIAQKAAESLAVALNAFDMGGITTDLDQEVFGVGVRHRFFSFWHTGVFYFHFPFPFHCPFTFLSFLFLFLFCANANIFIVFPADYLSRVSVNAGNLEAEHFTWMKAYPVSVLGLDICDPQQRLKIFQGFVAIRDYVQAGVRIGKYVAQ
jgi:hypothetical protein